MCFIVVYYLLLTVFVIRSLIEVPMGEVPCQMRYLMSNVNDTNPAFADLTQCGNMSQM